MKSSRWIGGLGLGVGLCLAPGAFGEMIVFSENFESLNLGRINTQGGWVQSSGTEGPFVVDGPADSLNTTQVAGSASTSGVNPQAYKSATFDFQGQPEGIFRFDFYRDTNGTVSPYTGIGPAVDSSTGTGLAFIVYGASTFQWRAAPNRGDAITMTDVDGTSLNIISSENWYRVEARFTLADNTITEVWIRNLTTEADPVRAYFGANQPTYAMPTPITNWGRMWLRTSTKGDTNHHDVYFDNIMVVAIPEPGTLASLTLAVAGLAGWLRRRRAAPTA